MPNAVEYQRRKAYYLEYNKSAQRKANLKKYRDTEKGKRSHRISNWIAKGMKCDDWNAMYDKYNQTKFCNYCGIEFFKLEENDLDRHLDHDHKTGEIRGIICRSCNCRDALKHINLM